MKATIGIDIGGSTTKIAGFTEEKKLLDTLQVKASDQITSLYGALGRFLREHRLRPADISKIVLTGVGASFIEEDTMQPNRQSSGTGCHRTRRTGSGRSG